MSVSGLRCNASLDQWATLVSVVDEGGVHAAARAMGRSHSAVSAAVLRLQDLVGAELLEVRGRRSVATSTGTIVVRHARRLLSQARELEGLCESLTMGWEPELVVAVDVVVAGEFLRRVLARFAPASRGTRVRIERHAVADAALAAMSDRFDLVLTASLPPGVHPRPLGSVAMTAVVSKSHALAGASGREVLLSRELQIVIGDTYTGAHEEGWLRSERRWTVPDFAVARSVLAAGQGFCIVPRQMFVSELAAGELVEIAPEHTRTMDVHLVLPKGDSIGPSAQRLRDCVLAEPLSSVALATT